MQPPFQKLSRFDEATSPEVTMTESHTRCTSRGKNQTLVESVVLESYPGRDTPL